VPADYEKIRDENIARYGWDTAVLDLLGQLYSERTHFIFELIQNAEDAGASELAFELFSDRLELRHDGRPFTEADVRGVCGVGQSGKSADLTKIGKFGIGFKSVYAYTKTPHIYSDGEHFRIENFVRPVAVPPPASAVSGTLFAFPFDHDGVSAATAVREIAAALTAIKPRTLLFLANIGRLRVSGTGVADVVIGRQANSGPGAFRRVMLSKGRGHREDWLLWDRPVHSHPAQRIEIAFRSEAGRIVGSGDSPLTVFFPTEKPTYLGFLIQGPYRTTPARDNIPEQDPSNQALVRETAGLLTDVLRELRDDGLLTVDVLQALPVDAARFAPGSMFRPLFDSVREALAAEALIPAAGGGHGTGGYGTGGELMLAQGPELLELLGPDQLGALYGADRPARFASDAITEHLTPALWRYLREDIGLDEVTPEDVVNRLSGEFLQAQSDEWIVRLYAFLFRHSGLWRAARFDGEPAGPARAKPVIRLEDGRQVAPFDAQDRPAVYLPGPVTSRLPTVRRAIAASPAAGPFLAALNLAEPDLMAEVLQVILPRYHDLDISALDPVQHDADVEGVARVLDEAAPGPRAGLLGQLRDTPFLIGENAATGERRLMPPPRLYQRTKELETYFDGNPGAWFAADRYGPWLVQLRGMGVRPQVDVHARTANQLGYVVITVDFGRNERGLDGFDPDAQIDGLEFALGHPSHARSEFVWNALLAPNRRLVAGVVERSVLQSFSDASQDHVASAIAVAAEREAWLPGRDGGWHRPAELSLDDLPPTYARDEGLAQALHMLQPVVAQAARQLGIAPEVLWGLSARPDLIALIERELAAGPPAS
jgi:hypothetical protein